MKCGWGDIAARQGGGRTSKMQDLASYYAIYKSHNSYISATAFRVWGINNNLLSTLSSAMSCLEWATKHTLRVIKRASMDNTRERASLVATFLLFRESHFQAAFRFASFGLWHKFPELCENIPANFQEFSLCHPKMLCGGTFLQSVFTSGQLEVQD